MECDRLPDIFIQLVHRLALRENILANARAPPGFAVVVDLTLTSMLLSYLFAASKPIIFEGRAASWEFNPSGTCQRLWHGLTLLSQSVLRQPAESREHRASQTTMKTKKPARCTTAGNIGPVIGCKIGLNRISNLRIMIKRSRRPNQAK